MQPASSKGSHDADFGRGVSRASYAGHDRRPLFRAEYVSHWLAL